MRRSSSMQMDLLNSGRLDGFCLVSSDSDFTRLATRIREAGLVVYGFGEKKTPRAFVAACDKFIHTELLRTPPVPIPADEAKSDPLKLILLAAIEAAAQEDGWAPLSAVGSMLIKNNPAFDPRTYGCQKLGALVKAQSYLDVRNAPMEGSAGVRVFVRPKVAKRRVSASAALV
jgi:hypothetical protein